MHAPSPSPLPPAPGARVIEQLVRELLFPFQVRLVLLQLALPLRLLGHDIHESDSGEEGVVVVLASGGAEGSVAAQDAVFADCILGLHVSNTNA